MNARYTSALCRAAALCLLFLIGARPSVAADCTWVDGNSTWSNASSWSCVVVPDADDDVTINTSVTVTLDVDVTVGALRLSNGLLDGPGTLTITGPFVWGDGGKMDGTGTTVAQGGTTIAGQVSVRLGRPLDLASDTRWEGNNITMLPGSSILNRSGRTFTDDARPLSNTHAISVPGGTPAAELPTITNLGRWLHAGAGSGFAVNFVNEGTLTSSSDGLGFVNGQVTMSNVAVLRGAGFLNVAGTAAGAGLTHPGSTRPGPELSQEAVGRLRVRGDFTMTVEHDLQIDLAGTEPGTEYDQLAFEDSDVVVDGTLYLTFAEEFVPAVGQAFDIVTQSGSAGSVTGCYEDGDIVVRPETYEVEVTCTSSGVRAVVLGSTASEGAPAAAAALTTPRPNPFAGRTTLELTTQSAGPVVVGVYDTLGRRVRVLFEGAVAAGERVPLALDGSALPAGYYIVRATGETFELTQRAILTR